MKQLRNFGDERQLATCVYCARDTGTREHVPSKVFLDKPYPENLPIVPACRRCNESFSLDEEYVACLVECVVAGSTALDSIARREKIAAILRMKPALTARLERSRREKDSNVVFDVEWKRVRNTVLKLARGHAAFELNEPRREEPARVAAVPLLSLDAGAADAFLTLPQSAAGWPEVGSRAMQRLVGCTPGEADWITVQPGRYRYRTVLDDGIIVRMIIGGYLACEVVWT